MTWFGWLFVATYAVSTAASVLIVNKPRKPLTPEMLLFSLVTQAAWLLGVLTVGTGHL